MSRLIRIIKQIRKRKCILIFEKLDSLYSENRQQMPDKIKPFSF